MTHNLLELQNFLDSQIPIARFMGVRVIAYEKQALRLGAPLSPNTNHHGTAFGGGIASLGFIAGWAYTSLRLQQAELSASLVIGKSEIRFLSPVRGAFEATVALKQEDDWQNFIRQLEQTGKAHLQLSPIISSAGVTAAELQNSYTAFIDKNMTGTKKAG